MSRSIRAGTNPKIRVDIVDGDLSVVGWEGEDLLVKADDEGLRLEQNAEEILLSCHDDVSLRVPKGASLNVNTVHGDAALRGVLGNIELNEVNGDLSIREAGPVSINSIGSDFSLKSAKGNLYLKSAGGDVSIRDVEGSVTIDSAADDLALRGARGDIDVNVGEDVVVYLEPRADGEYSITAGDDILLVLPPNSDATINMQGDRIDIDWPGVEEDEGATQRVIVLGSGTAKIDLTAGGDVRVSNRANAGESADEFGNFAGLNFDWSGFGDRISRQVEQATARAAKRAEEAARRAGRIAERHARRHKSGLVVGRWNWDFQSKGAPIPPVPPPEPVSED